MPNWTDAEIERQRIADERFELERERQELGDVQEMSAELSRLRGEVEEARARVKELEAERDEIHRVACARLAALEEQQSSLVETARKIGWNVLPGELVRYLSDFQSRALELEARSQSFDDHKAACARLRDILGCTFGECTEEVAGKRMARLASLEAPPVVPSPWLIRKRKGKWTLFTDLDGAKEAIAIVNDDGWLRTLDGCPNVAPVEAVKALFYANTHNRIPPHSDAADAHAG